MDTRVNFQNGEPNSAINDILILDFLFSSSLFATVWSVEVFLRVLPSIRMRAIIALKLMSFFGSPNSKHGTPLSRDGHGIEAGYFGEFGDAWRTSLVEVVSVFSFPVRRIFRGELRSREQLFLVAFSYFRRDSRFRRWQLAKRTLFGCSAKMFWSSLFLLLIFLLSFRRQLGHYRNVVGRSHRLVSSFCCCHFERQSEWIWNRATIFFHIRDIYFGNQVFSKVLVAP